MSYSIPHTVRVISSIPLYDLNYLTLKKFGTVLRINNKMYSSSKHIYFTTTSWRRSVVGPLSLSRKKKKRFLCLNYLPMSLATYIQFFQALQGKMLYSSREWVNSKVIFPFFKFFCSILSFETGFNRFVKAKSFTL